MTEANLDLYLALVEAGASKERARLDDLILGLRDSLGATVVVVTHALASILTIGDHGVFLDPETKTILAAGNPTILRDTSPEPKMRAFLRRGEADTTTAA